VLLVEGDKSVRDLLAESVNQLARCDYPSRWPNLLPEVLSQVQSGDPLRMHNSLLALRQVRTLDPGHVHARARAVGSALG
jgi:hypothetical protein